MIKIPNYKCSMCKYTVPYRKAVFINGKREYNYCPHCGAKMDLDKEGDLKCLKPCSLR